MMKCYELVHPDCIPLRTAVLELFRQGRKAIILDLLEITSINSSGITEIASAYVDALNCGSRLFIVFSKNIIRSMKKRKTLREPAPYFKTLEDAIGEAHDWCLDQKIYDRFANTV